MGLLEEVEALPSKKVKTKLTVKNARDLSGRTTGVIGAAGTVVLAVRNMEPEQIVLASLATFSAVTALCAAWANRERITTWFVGAGVEGRGTVSATATVTRSLNRSRAYTAPASTRASAHALLTRPDGTVLQRGDN